MNNCLIYIFLIFLISFVLLNLIKQYNDKKIEGMVNILDITLNDLELEKSKLGLPDIPEDKDMVNKYTISDQISTDQIGTEFIKRRFKKYDVPLQTIEQQNIEQQGKEKYNQIQYFDEKYPENAPYEQITPVLQNVKIRDKNKVYYSKESISDEIYETDRIYGLPDVNLTDCQGKWNEWDETHCIPGNRCSLKFRTFKVTREKKLDGDECSYDGKEIYDGDIDYDYCYGNNNKSRCGVDENVCECDLDNIDSEKCDFDLSNDECICPDGYILSTSETNAGLCVTGTDAIPTPVPAPAPVPIGQLNKEELRQIREMLQGQAPQRTQRSGFEIASLLRLAMAEELLNEAEAVQRGEDFDKEEFERRIAEDIAMISQQSGSELGEEEEEDIGK